jgi:hypothetical protein
VTAQNFCSEDEALPRLVRGTSQEPHGVVAEDLEAVFAAAILPGLVADDVVELGGEGGGIGGREGEEGGEGCGVGVEEGVVAVLVGLGAGGVEDGLGLLEAGEAAGPQRHLVIPDLMLGGHRPPDGA